MTRNLKAFGLALVASFALSAVAASAASALVSDHFIGAAKGGKLESNATSAQVFLPVTEQEKGWTCAEIDVAGEITKEIATEVEVEPKYTKCEQYENGKGTGTSITVVQNQCKYLFTGTTTEGNPTKDGKHANTHIKCPAGKSIETLATGFKFKCKTIGSQEVTHAVTYANVETPSKGTHIEAKVTAHGIDSTTLGVCGEGTHTNGSYTGNATLTTQGGGNLSVTST